MLKRLRMFAFSVIWALFPCLALGAACQVTKPADCRSLNDLRDAPGFFERVKDFLGSAPVDYFIHHNSLAEQAILGLSGPPSRVLRVDGDLLLFSSCPPHDCAGNAVAVVLDKHGEIRAVAFSSYHCAEQCGRNRYIDIYVHRGPSFGGIVNSLENWGVSEEIEANLIAPESGGGMKERTKVHVL